MADFLDQPGALEARLAQLERERLRFLSPVVTTLPAQPIDGQRITYSPEAGIEWHFVFRSGAPAPYRWIADGAQVPLLGEVFAAESTSSASYTNLATVGPLVSLPFEGDYIVGRGSFIRTPAAGAALARMSFAIGGGAASDNDDIIGEQQDTSTPRSGHNGSRTSRLNAVGAVTLTAKYRVTASTSEFSRRWLSATPVRVG